MKHHWASISSNGSKLDIQHLEGIGVTRITTSRLETQVLSAGDRTLEPVIFLHGNVSAGTIWEELMLELNRQFWCLAPDLRGFGKADSDALIDATRGVMEWVDDLEALADALDIEHFHLVGHSLGGMVTWGALAQLSDRLLSATLIAPGSPYGFGGTHGEEGNPNNKEFTGSGAGIVNPNLVAKINEGDRTENDPLFSPRVVLNRLVWKPDFRPAREEDLLTAMLQVHKGPKRYPGDYTESNLWPGTAPGKWGAANAISPKYNQQLVEQLLAIDAKPNLLWMQGEDDLVISDTSYSEPGFQGKMGVRPDWPGAEMFPPQPMVSQTRSVLDRYEDRGGIVTRLMVPDSGHSPFLEKPNLVIPELKKHLLQSRTKH
jgi:pimeloyl-ACP methyl ester carboxylesterase